MRNTPRHPGFELDDAIIDLQLDDATPFEELDELPLPPGRVYLEVAAHTPAAVPSWAPFGRGGFA